MNAQLKKDYWNFCVLAVLKKGDSYGYQIIKDMSRCIEISESTLYPILKRLEQNNYVETYSQEHNSRLRKYYRMTESGREHMAQFLEEWDQVMAIYDFISGGQGNE